MQVDKELHYQAYDVNYIDYKIDGHFSSFPCLRLFASTAVPGSERIFHLITFLTDGQAIGARLKRPRYLRSVERLSPWLR